MQQAAYRPLAVTLRVLVCAAAAVSLWPLGLHVGTDDKNRDGRPDLWRMYDPDGELASIAVDTNFDGRSDVQEYYQRGALVRRESDRDYNDRVDLVQEFDANTRQAVRSLSDVDFDGVADLLVLFQSGRPVYSKWAHAPTPVDLRSRSADRNHASHRGADRQLTPLEDPFRADLAISATRIGIGFGDYVGLASSGGLPASGRNLASPLASSSNLSNSTTSIPSSTTGVHYSPRGPPVSDLLS